MKNRDLRYSRLLLPVPLLLWTLSGTLLFSAESGSIRPGRWTATGVDFSDFMPSEAFRDAIAPAALKLACAENLPSLVRTFREAELPFEGGLLRTVGGRPCHIWFEPTLKGFRADPDNWPIEELFFDVDTLSFLTLRESMVGDSLDILKQVVRSLPASVSTTVGLSTHQSPEWLQEAALHHFGSGTEIRLRDNSGMESANPWVQDYLKSGHVGSDRQVLVTRTLFEGAEEAGVLFAPLLGSFESYGFTRSKLSWEGGDLQFVEHPWNPDIRILVYGKTAKKYWGEELTDEEYAYVLRLEFGADYLVDMSGLAPHVDYVVSFIPQGNHVLVSTPVQNNFRIARAAWKLLRETYGHVRQEEILEIDRIISQGPETFRRSSDRVEFFLCRIREAAFPWTLRDYGTLNQKIATYVALNCPADSKGCLEVEKPNERLRQDREFMAEWLGASLTNWTDHYLPDVLLAIVASQLDHYSTDLPERLKEKIGELERLGFEVIESPRLGGNEELGLSWPGVSYVNALYLDKSLYVPTLGLGPEEARLLRGLQKELPDSVRLVPVYAQHMLVHNGGIHCVAAMLRQRPLARPGNSTPDPVPVHLAD